MAVRENTSMSAWDLGPDGKGGNLHRFLRFPPAHRARESNFGLRRPRPGRCLQEEVATRLHFDGQTSRTPAWSPLATV